MKVLKILFIILVLIIAIIIVIGLFLPSEINVQRTIVISSTPTQIFPQINKFRNWSNWTAWAKKDTNPMYYNHGGIITFFPNITKRVIKALILYYGFLDNQEIKLDN